MKIRKENGVKIFFSKGIITIFLLLILALAVLPSNAEAAKLNKKSTTLLKGKTVTLQLKGTKNKAIWKITRKGVVVFSTKNNTSVKVRAIRTGETIVSARIGKKTYKCKIRVVDPKLSVKSVNLLVGETKTLKVFDGTGGVKWKSDNPSIIAVNKGRITAKKAGQAKITAVCNRRKMTCMVNVKKKIPEKNEGNTNTKPDQQQGKKVWVVTKEAYTEYIPVYTNIRSQWECTCGYKTEDSDAFDIHERDHLFNKEPSAWRVNTLEDFSHMEIIKHPEEGYWKNV